MQVYLVKEHKVQFSEQKRLYYPNLNTIAVRQFTVELNPTEMKWPQADPDERSSSYGLYERVTQFLIANKNASKNVIVQFVNAVDQGFLQTYSRQREKLELKVLGDILLDFHSTFGRSLRLTLEMSKTSLINSGGVHGNIAVYSGFPVLRREHPQLEPRPPPPTIFPSLSTDSSIFHSMMPVRQHAITEEPRISLENIPLPPSPQHPVVECATKPMKIVIIPGVAAYCADDAVKFPKSWLRHWTAIERGDFQMTAEINIILSVVEDSDDEHETETDEILSLAKKMLQEEVKTDLEIIPGNGKAVKCHSVFLVAQSQVFEGMLVSCKGMAEAQTNTISIEDMSEEGVKALLAYLYFRDLEKANQCSFVAVELLEAGQKYFIDKLEARVKNILLVKPKEWFHVDAALTLFFFAAKLEQHLDLKTTCVKILKSKPLQLKGSIMYQKLFRENQQAALEISNAFLDSV